MYIGIDSDGRKVDIISALPEISYYCPACRQLLTQRRGAKRIHHFAHHKGSRLCEDNWPERDMSPWRRDWQARFPVQSREAILTNGTEKHRTDVMINNLVIEFRSGDISVREFNMRNNFYCKCGKSVIWIFNLIEEYETGKIRKGRQHAQYIWDAPYGIFKNFADHSDNITVYFQMINGIVELVKNGYKDYKIFYTSRWVPASNLVALAHKMPNTLLVSSQNPSKRTEADG